MVFMRLFAAEFKAMCHKLPRIIFGGVVIIAVVTMFVLLISSQKSDKGKNIIAVYAPNDTFTNIAITAVENMDSVSKICKLVRVNENEAEAMVYDNRASAALIFQENFVEDIINGKNTQPRIIVNEKGNELFMELAKCGSSILAVVQAGIYSAEKSYYEQTGQRISHQENKKLNMEYINTVFSRENAFNKINNSGIKLSEYYASMLIPVFLLLFAMALSEIAFPEKIAFYNYTKLAYPLIVLIQFIKILTVELVLFGGIYGVCYIFDLIIFPDIITVINISAIATMFYSISENRINASLCIMFFTIVMGFIGGCFLPPALLPDTVKNIMEYTPLNVMGNQLMGNINILYSGITFAVSAVIACAGGVKK